MKINFPKIKKHFKKESFEISPEKYWQLLVLLFFAVLVLSFVSSYNLYQGINKEDAIFGENNIGKAEKDKKDKINKVLKYFEEREKKSIEILNSENSIVDPSL